MDKNADVDKEKAAGQPSGLHETLIKFNEEVLKKPASSEKAAPGDATPPAKAGEKADESVKKEAPGEGKPGDQKPRPSPLKFVNDKGESVPFTFAADGKDLSEADPEKVRTYASLGFHASQTLESMNKEKETLRKERGEIDAVKGEYEQARSLLQKFVTAINEGTLVRVEPKSKGKGEETTTEEEGGYIDPDVRKLRDENKALAGKVDKQAKDMESITAMILGEQLTSIKAEMDEEIAKAAEKFPVPKEILDEEIWPLLAALGEDKKPKYSSPEDAVKHLHESLKEKYAKLSKFPGFINLTDEEKMAELKKSQTAGSPGSEKAEGKEERPPILSPSGSAALKKEGEKPKFTGISDAMQAFSRDLAESKAKGAAS